MLETLEQLDTLVQPTTERCVRGGNHAKIADMALAERRRLGLNVSESFVLCLFCCKKVALG
jgi:hypothetical protein